MSVTEHWLAYRDRWQDEPKVITPRDDDDVAEWRRLGYRVEGPFVLEAEQPQGAVERIGQLERALLMAESWLPEPHKQTVREVLGASTTPLGGR